MAEKNEDKKTNIIGIIILIIVAIFIVFFPPWIIWNTYNFLSSKIIQLQIPLISKYPTHTIVISLSLLILLCAFLWSRGEKLEQEAKNPLQGII